MRQGRVDEASRLAETTLAKYDNISEWRISASCLQTIAESCRLRACYCVEQMYRLRIVDLYEKKLGHDHKATFDAIDALADCYLNSSRRFETEDVYKRVHSWRSMRFGQNHTDAVRVIECWGICHAYEGQDAEAETAYLDAIGWKTDTDVQLLNNLRMTLRNQGKWETLERWSRQSCAPDSIYQPSAHRGLIIALEA